MRVSEKAAAEEGAEEERAAKDEDEHEESNAGAAENPVEEMDGSVEAKAVRVDEEQGAFLPLLSVTSPLFSPPKKGATVEAEGPGVGPGTGAAPAAKGRESESTTESSRIIREEELKEMSPPVLVLSWEL